MVNLSRRLSNRVVMSLSLPGGARNNFPNMTQEIRLVERLPRGYPPGNDNFLERLIGMQRRPSHQQCSYLFSFALWYSILYIHQPGKLFRYSYVHQERNVSEDGRKRVNVSGFLDDFSRGASDRELRERFGLTHSQLTRLVGVLKEKGQLSSEIMRERENNLKIRFGSTQGPPDSEGSLSVDLNTGLVLHCPSCGAAVKREAQRCDYCAAHLDFSLKGKTVNCPHCFAETPADGRFCMRCAKTVKGLIKDGLRLDDRLCPRCDLPMRARKIGDFSVMYCEKCTGSFIPDETFEMMQENADRVVFSLDSGKRAPAKSDMAVRYVRCPVCRKVMNRMNFARISGIIIDACRGHGVWFDPGEIEKIMDFIARGGLQKSKVEELERLKAEEKIQKIKNMQISGRAGSDSWEVYPDAQGGLYTADLVSWVWDLLKR